MGALSAGLPGYAVAPCRRGDKAGTSFRPLTRGLEHWHGYGTPGRALAEHPGWDSAPDSRKGGDDTGPEPAALADRARRGGPRVSRPCHKTTAPWRKATMTKPRATPLAAQVEAAVERAEKAEGQVAALDYGLKAAHHQARCLKGELTKLQEAQKAAKARIKELEADQKPAPPPDKSECPLYGKAATMKTVFELYDIEAAARRAMQRELGTVSAMLTATERALASAKHRGDDYLYMYNAALRQLADQRAYHEAAKLKPGNCVSVPSPNYGDEPSLFPFFAGGLSGAVLGGVSALIACGGLL